MTSDDPDEAFVKSVEAWIAAKRVWSGNADPSETDKINALFADMKAKFFGLGATRPIQNRTN
jgi:hypothetical protein